MFRQIVINLDKEYYITALDEKNDVSVEVFKCQKSIGKARLVTDNVDVSCITSIQIDDEHVNNIFNSQFTLGEIVLKFLLKFPTIVRKPEFRFILDVPENLKDTILKSHFERGEDTNLKNEILIRDKILLPNKYQSPNNIHFSQSINTEDFPKLLSLLRNNAYWQSHLTLDRLTLLINNSRCFYAISDTQEIVGFARVLTNNTSFASLWDVVVSDQYRGNGIGIALMYEVFTDSVLKDIHNWILFTDSAKGLYQKFGFVPEDEVQNRKMMYKLRIQDAPPSYMSELIKLTSNERVIHLTSDQTFKFLFNEKGKRANLTHFWDEISKIYEPIQCDCKALCSISNNK